MKLKLEQTDLDAAVESNLLSTQQSRDLWDFLQTRQQGSLKALNVLAYFGAFIVIASMTWFATKAFSEADPRILLATGAVYFVTFLLAGLYLFRKGQRVPAMLSLTVSTFLVPLTVFALQRLLGLDFQTPGNYHDFYVWINQGWFFMEVSTIAVAAVYLRLFSFELLTLPLAFSLWFLSMDLTPILFGKDFDWEERRLVSIWFGLAMLAVSYAFDLLKKERDYSFWLYLFGLLAFWCALSFSSTESHLLKALYCLMNIGLVAVSLLLKRTVFLVFGGLGIFMYLFDLADHVFRDSFFFPLYLSLVGIALLGLAVWLHRKRGAIDDFLSRRIPEPLKRFVPKGK